MEEQVEQVETMKTTKNLLTWSKSFIGMDVVGFCFGTGLMLAVKTVNNLEELIRR